MVNQVRTLLLNLRPSGSSRPAGEEYIPPDYVPPDLPKNLRDIRAALFGPNPTRTAMNLLIGRMLAYLHTSPLCDDIVAEDPRITYDPSNPASDADRESSSWNPSDAAITGIPGADEIFRPERSEAEARWLEYWLADELPGPLRVGGLMLALAARTLDIINGTTD